MASGYNSFRDWLERHNRELFRVYSTVCDYDGLWSDFEKRMAYINRDFFINAGAIALPDLKKDPDDYSMADYCLAGDFARETVDSFLSDLRNAFHNWIRSVKTPRTYESKKLMVDTEARFLHSIIQISLKPNMVSLAKTSNTFMVTSMLREEHWLLATQKTVRSYISLGIIGKAFQSLDIIRKVESIINEMMRGRHTIVNCPNTAVLQKLRNLTTMNPVNPYKR